MSIHWTLIAGFLYAEIGKNATTKTISDWDKSLGTVRQKFKWLLTGTILLLLVPFISTKMWNKVHYILMSLVLSFLFDVLYCLFSFLFILFSRCSSQGSFAAWSPSWFIISMCWWVYFNWDLICTFHVVLEWEFLMCSPQVAILILFFLDAIREMQKYSAEETQQKTVSQSRSWSKV